MYKNRLRQKLSQPSQPFFTLKFPQKGNTQKSKSNLPNIQLG